ncbi:MAG: DUF3795 domain-containing protein [Planctomycetota bacterium]
MTERRTEVGACGHYCAGCLDYRSLAENDDNLRRQVAATIKKEMNRDVPLDQVGCEGCWGNIHNAWTASLQCEIRQCVKAKGFATCADCRDFPCAVYLKQFAENSDYAKNIRAIQRDTLGIWLRNKQ